jgi:hypothetical protein
VQVVSNNLYDVFGVLRHQQGSAQTPWRWRSLALSPEDLLISGGLVVLPRVVTVSALKAFPLRILPGVGIGVGVVIGVGIGFWVCVHRAYEDAMRDDFLGSNLVTDVGVYCIIDLVTFLLLPKPSVRQNPLRSAPPFW